jgi:hypothetical protein
VHSRALLCHSILKLPLAVCVILINASITIVSSFMVLCAHEGGRWQCVLPAGHIRSCQVTRVHISYAACRCCCAGIGVQAPLRTCRASCEQEIQQATCQTWAQKAMFPFPWLRAWHGPAAADPASAVPSGWGLRLPPPQNTYTHHTCRSIPAPAPFTCLHPPLFGPIIRCAVLYAPLPIVRCAVLYAPLPTVRCAVLYAPPPP